MNRARPHRWFTLLALFGVLISALALPLRAPQALAVSRIDRGGAAVAALDNPGDEQLVQPSLQHPIQDDAFYFVMPDRFSNGNLTNDTGGIAGGPTSHGFLPSDKGYYHGGDIKGLQSKLDYLQGLGISAIWMTPIFKNKPLQSDPSSLYGVSAGYHGYWITDFTQVDPHLGTNQDLSDLIADAHHRGIKVFFDIITNHTADVIDYAGGNHSYVGKDEIPYKDASGKAFDDAAYAGTNSFPALDPNISFPYKPIFKTTADATVKKPAWLNNPIYYHNRGDSSFSGENSLYGDFFGLDDLFTEQPAVAQGMTDIYKTWIKDFGIDGYRIDTVKHVNMEFWQKFAPEILAYARANGKPNFFMYGEVFDSNPAFDSRFTTKGRLQAVLDFGFQSSARSFASQSAATNNLRDFFAKDDYYTDADSNAYSLPTFLGNHDMGRFGLFLRNDNGGKPDAELLARDKLGHALMFFARGMPVVYYGDEQGFTGDGGDKDARQDMFASQVGSYNDDDLIGSDSTTAVANYNPSHPLYQAIKAYSDIRKANKALRRGAQIHRYGTDAAGIYAFSRIDRGEKVEYIVALNNALTPQTATFKTYLANTGYTAVYAPNGSATLTTNAQAEIAVDVPALGFVIYKASRPLPASSAAPSISMSAPTQSQDVRFEVGAQLGSDQLAEVTFAVKVADGGYTVIGTDNNAPYRIFYDASHLADGTRLTFKAIVNDLNGHRSSATADAVVTKEPVGGGGTCTPPAYAVVHYQRTDGNYAGWGLHLWGDAIDPSEVTTWTSPKLFSGVDNYGAFAYIKLKDASKPVNFIVHNGDTKDPDGDRSFTPATTPEIWLKSGVATIYATAAAAQGSVTIHYQRTDGNYAGWGLHLWGDAIDPSEATTWATPKLFDQTDSYGVYVTVKLKDASKPVNFIVHNGDTKDPDGDRSFVPNETPAVWLKTGDATIYPSRAAAENVAIIHYHRSAGDYAGWGLHVWTGAQNPTEWATPLQPAGTDGFGVYFRVPLLAGATKLNYIIHNGDTKDLDPDQELNLVTFGHEIWVLQSTPAYLLPLLRVQCNAAPPDVGDLSKQKAHWVSRDTLLVDIRGGAANAYQLHFDPTGAIALDKDLKIIGGQSIALTFDPAALTDAIKAKFPHLAGFAALKISKGDLAQVPVILKGQIAVSAIGPAGNQAEATGVQIPGVLDDLYANNSALGVSYRNAALTLSVWAPTARSVKLHLFADSNPATTSTVYPMTGDPATGVWSIAGGASWTNKFYLYEVEVFVPSTGKVEHNLVTDPYSISLATNSKRSQIVNLADPRLKPGGWDTLKKPALVAPEDISLYELHVRDFSINDTSVAAAKRGTFMAFTEEASNGMRHLEQLAEAGLTHVHLLPAFDCATIEENKALRQEPDPAVLSGYAPDSDQQQAIIAPYRDKDGFNWCYDPFHYTVPEGSYSTNPDGVQRILEFREMVKALNHAGLRVVMDVVYNHTAASGQNDKSVLDKVVPGYYQRLNLEGQVETSTCCSNTASEHAMMEKLMVDSLVTWATAYKVDGFRFDLMGHHMKANMLKVRDRLRALSLARDGVDGKQIYLYGEGWNFGEVANNARGENATQQNLAGTGIGTFSDRLRDAVRGGGPFDDGANKKIQGFINGLYYDPNDLPQGGLEAQKQRLLLYQDQIKVGLAGNLKDYTLVDRNGNSVRGDQVDYNGSPAGYTLDPQEVITYIEAHDNETLFDKNQYAAPAGASIADRVRMQNLGVSIVTLSQGIPFLQAGQDMLRSKSLDRNSYNSGDWFNKLDFTYNSNNWGVGLPPAVDNQSNWSIMQPLLANPALKPARANILTAAEHFREMLWIRNSSPLFRLRSGAEVKARLSFLNSGPDQVPGLIVMQLSDTVGANIDKHYQRIVVLFNANDQAQTFTAAGLQGLKLLLHPVQAESADALVRTSTFNNATGTFVVPARTTAVFVLKD